MDVLNKKLPATTLIESLVAMVVILLSFGIAATIFANVTSSSPVHQKIRTEILLQEIGERSRSEKNYLDGEMETHGMKIQKKVVPYVDAPGLSLLSLTAFDKENKIICERKELIFSE